MVYGLVHIFPTGVSLTSVFVDRVALLRHNDGIKTINVLFSYTGFLHHLVRLCETGVCDLCAQLACQVCRCSLSFVFASLTFSTPQFEHSLPFFIPVGRATVIPLGQLLAYATRV